jgi:DNA repair exonuclease SbcCD ATPase subunit
MADYEKRLSYLCGDDDQDKVVDSLIEDIEYLNSEREKMSKEINEKRAKHGALSSEIQQRKLGLKFKSVAELDLYMTQKEKMQTQLETLQKETNPNMDKISVLEETLVDESEIKNECEELVNLEKHTGYLIKLLTDPKSFIRKNILEQYIPAVNKKILENTQELGLGHVCKINSDLSVDVTYMNRPVSYYNLSQGERLRLNLAVSSAFRHLMGLLGKSCNIALVDEYLDSALDSEGMRKAFSFIKKQAKSVWIVSHKDELKGQTDRTMTVVKQNGFSSIEWA